MPITKVKVNVKVLDEWIKDRKYTISEFCKIVKITRCGYYQYRKGVSPSEEIRHRIAYVTGIQVDRLFTRLMEVQKGRTPKQKLMVSDGTWVKNSKDYKEVT
jgi:transcriptional regulator with XRE-family HTH domain